VLRYFHVFNVEQCDGLDVEPIATIAEQQRIHATAAPCACRRARPRP
jgi:antirestriction protein ArdC